MNLSGMRRLVAFSRRAREWIEDNVNYEGWQGNPGYGICGDWRMMESIREAMLSEGFRDGRRWWEFWVKPDFAVA
jgi:hypothetical protein